MGSTPKLDKRGLEDSECDGGRNLGEVEERRGGMEDGRWEDNMWGDIEDVML